MKKILLIIGLLLLITAESQSSNRGRVTFEFFYNSLAPYGEWIEIDRNFYVWKPMRVRYDWRPYSDGRWVWTRQGWYWVSYEPFGWAVFHYGRWHYDDYYGWIWIPGYDWSPAWVEWRYDDDYIGWAPLPPYATFSIHIGISFTRHWASPIHHWSFVRYRHFCSPRVNDYYEPVERTRRFFGETRYRTDYRYENERILNGGVDREFIEQRTGQRIRTAEITETRERKTDRIIREGDRPKIEVYRPDDREIERNRPERIEARRSDRASTLDLEKVDRTIYRERSDRQESERGTEKRDLRENQRPDDRRVQERKEPVERGREIYREERKENQQLSEPRKRSDRYRTQPEPERKSEERRPEIQRERQPEIQREERRREVPEQRREIKPERREREIEIRREEVKPREYREEPKSENRQRNDGQREGSRETRTRTR